MSNEHPNTATEECMAALTITQPTYQEVYVCQSSSIGENLLHDLGVETNQLDPEHYFIPWITYDKIWVREEFEATLANMEEFLCSDKLSHVPECKP